MRVSQHSSSFFLRIPKSVNESSSTQRESVPIPKNAISLKQAIFIEKRNVVNDQAKTILSRMRELAIRATDETMTMGSDERFDLQIEIVTLFGELEKIRSSKDEKTIDAETTAKIEAINRFRDLWKYPLGEDPATYELTQKIEEDFMHNEAHFEMNAKLKSQYDESLIILKEKYTLRKQEQELDDLIEISEKTASFEDAKNYNLHNITDENDRSHLDFVNNMQNLARINEWEDLGGGRYFSQVAVGWTVSCARTEVARDDMKALEFMPVSLFTYLEATEAVVRIEQLIDGLSNNSLNFSALYQEWTEQAREKMETRHLFQSALGPNTRYDIPTIYNSYMSGYAQNGDVGFLKWSFLDILQR